MGALAVCVLAYGLWAIFGKLGARSLDPVLCQAVACATAGVFAPVLFVAARIQGRPTAITTGIGWVVAAQVCATVATLAFYFALKTRDAASSTGVSSLYLVVTCILSAVFLREPMGPAKVFGVLLIVIGTWVLARS